MLTPFVVVLINHHSLKLAQYAKKYYLWLVNLSNVFPINEIAGSAFAVFFSFICAAKKQMPHTVYTAGLPIIKPLIILEYWQPSPAPSLGYIHFWHFNYSYRFPRPVEWWIQASTSQTCSFVYSCIFYSYRWQTESVIRWYSYVWHGKKISSTGTDVYWWCRTFLFTH